MPRSAPAHLLWDAFLSSSTEFRLFPLLVLFVLPITPAVLRAQDGTQCIDCVPDYAVEVTPDGAAEPGRAAFTGGFHATFTVHNTGALDDTYALTCTAPPQGSCSVAPTELSLASQQQTAVTVTYATGIAGAWTLTMQASSTGEGEGDMGSRNVSVTGAGLPLLSTAPQNTTYQNLGLCLAACFSGLYQHATPAYFSLGAARGLSLVYNSATHKPMPVLYLDVTRNAQTTAPTAYKIQVRKVSTGTWLTLQNDSTFAYFTPAATAPTRLAAVFDAIAAGLGTGLHSLTVVVTAVYPGVSVADSATTQVLVNDQTASVYGAGVSLGQIQRLREMSTPGSSVVITEPDGSIAYYLKSGSAYVKPLGGPESRLVYASGNPVSSRYTRTYLDSSFVQFNDKGFTTKASDRFGNATTYSYYGAPYDTLLASITDPMGKVISLCYAASGCAAANAKLHHVNVLGGAVQRTVTYTYDASSRLVNALDPDGYSDSLAYGANGVLAGVYDRARQRTDLLYNGALRLDSVQAPSVALYDGGTGRPTTRFRSVEQVVWQPATPGTTLGAPKTGVVGDTSIKALVVGPAADTMRFALDRFGAPLMVTDPYRRVTTITRDSHARPTQVVDPTAHYVQYTYNGADQLSSMVDGPGGRTIVYH